VEIYANEEECKELPDYISKDERSYTPSLFQDAIKIITDKGYYIDPEHYSKFKKIGEKAFMVYMEIKTEEVILSNQY
jgi:hypothetical protein